MKWAIWETEIEQLSCSRILMDRKCNIIQVPSPSFAILTCWHYGSSDGVAALADRFALWERCSGHHGIGCWWARQSVRMLWRGEQFSEFARNRAAKRWVSVVMFYPILPVLCFHQKDTTSFDSFVTRRGTSSGMVWIETCRLTNESYERNLPVFDPLIWYKALGGY